MTLAKTVGITVALALTLLTVTHTTATESPMLSPDLPSDVSTSDPIANRKDYDTYSWKSFIALNWPASEDGKADPNQTIGANGDAPPVWGFWMEDMQMLVKTGHTPPPWGTTPKPPAACLAIQGAQNVNKLLRHVTKTEGVVALSNQADAGPLIDQNSVYVRYEILINPPMYSYILDNKLYNLAGIAAVSPIQFPWDWSESSSTGATMVKASWKTIGPHDDPSRFHITKAFVYDTSNKACTVETLGLVGLHISTKTNSAPQWIWSTFEHVDNVPDQGGRHDGFYSFYNPDCDAAHGDALCKPNQMPATPWDPARPDQTPTQTTRITPLDSETASINAKYQDALKAVSPSSVWANYMLIGTQYPQKPSDTTDRTGKPFPLYLANTVIETFMQGDTPMVSSSCIGCHNRATAGPLGKPSDFTYLLSRVKAKD